MFCSEKEEDVDEDGEYKKRIRKSWMMSDKRAEISDQKLKKLLRSLLSSNHMSHF